MTELHCRSGDIIFREGDPSEFVCRIISGEIEIVKEHGDESLVLGIARTGEFVGEMGVISGRPRSATVRAMNDLSIELINKDDFLKLISTDSDTALQLLSRLSERLRLTDGMLVEVAMSGRKKTPPAPPDQALLNDRAAETAAETKDETRLTILAGSDGLANQLPKDGIPVSSFPFLVGRRPEENEVNVRMKLAMPKIDLMLLDFKPYRLSRVHFAVQSHQDDKYLIRDLGSALGTQVNGDFLGADFPRDVIELKAGENLIVAGGAESQFAFRILVDGK